jgi:hypothetical protein
LIGLLIDGNIGHSRCLMSRDSTGVRWKDGVGQTARS